MRLINADALKDKCYITVNGTTIGRNNYVMFHEIDEAPTIDAVEVVRCKDCKWYMLTDHNDTEICTNKQWDISMAVYPIISADDFCSYGERRKPTIPMFKEAEDAYKEWTGEDIGCKSFTADEWYRQNLKDGDE